SQYSRPSPSKAVLEPKQPKVVALQVVTGSRTLSSLPRSFQDLTWTLGCCSHFCKFWFGAHKTDQGHLSLHLTSIDSIRYRSRKPLPLISTRPTSLPQETPPSRREISAVTHTVPGSAASSMRAARLTVSPQISY